jgi:hypothetical protein
MSPPQHHRLSITHRDLTSVSSRPPRKVSGTKMLCKSREFGRDYKIPTFASSSPICPATESGLVLVFFVASETAVRGRTTSVFFVSCA